ncbi:tetraacyldisaccharide 4'-kinase [Silvibacterium acidisoli]|uniref:tetraacyldisaccharide 4'-kinase n=1 Tax=Acidobacteriaceae bacterium ZG23-2 TaxID=2883246 RepID=UPI00406D2FC9
MSRAALAAFNPLYAAAVALKNTAYDREWIAQKRLQWPVISVGNLSAGGSGKTPVVMELVRMLQMQDIHADVLSRGYGRTSQEVSRVNPDGSAEDFGDEPLLIAARTGVPVYVGPSRYEAGLLAEKSGASGSVHLLDDGFQHRQLARDADIVVLHTSDFEERLLPAGDLREPLASLRRASAIVIRSEDRHLEEQARRHGAAAPVWIQSRRMRLESAPRPLAFCGIARPAEFFAGLQREGVEPVATLAFRDHHRYSEQDIEELLRQLREKRAESFVTTEKDWVRLSPVQRQQLEAAAPLAAARLEVTFEDEAAVSAFLQSFAMRK